MILTGQINLETVTNLLTSVSRAFLNQERWKGMEISTEFWKPEVIQNPKEKYLPEKLGEMYDHIIQTKNLEPLLREPKEFAATIWFSFTPQYERTKWVASTEIINFTSIEDLVSGQIIPPVIKKFFIYSKKLTYNYQYSDTSWDLFEKFVEYRNQMIEQAQERLDQSVSKAAYNIMNDLHS